MTPTVIRHAQRGNTILQVITYDDKGRLCAVFQEYTFHPDTGRTVLNISQPYMGEHGAILEWQSHLYKVAV